MFKHYLGDESRGELAEIRYNITALLILNRRNVYLLTIGSIILVVMRFSWKYLNHMKVRENLHNEIGICVIQTGKKDIWVFKSRFYKDFRRVLFWVCGVHEQYILKSQCKDNHARRKKWFNPQNIWFLFHKHRTILNHEDRSIHIHVILIEITNDNQ